MSLALHFDIVLLFFDEEVISFCDQSTLSVVVVKFYFTVYFLLLRM